jgi:hypothetical protein
LRFGNLCSEEIAIFDATRRHPEYPAWVGLARTGLSVGGGVQLGLDFARQSPARRLLCPRWRSQPMNATAILLNPMFWTKKVKITILTIATFAALC